MQTNGNFEEIIIFVLLWVFFVVFVESFNQIILHAGPLEPIRSFFSRRSSFIADLLSCGYCSSVWVAFLIAWILPSPICLILHSGISNVFLEFTNNYLWWFLNGIILHRLSNVFHDRVTNIPDIEVIDNETNGPHS